MRIQKIIRGYHEDDFLVRFKRNEVWCKNRGYLCMKSPTNSYGYGTGGDDYPVWRKEITMEPGISYLATIEVVDPEHVKITQIPAVHVPVN